MAVITRARAQFEERKRAKSLENLPPELLAMIARFALSNKFRDCAALARVNRRFYDMLIRTLYRQFLKDRKLSQQFRRSIDAMQFALYTDRPCTLSRLIEAGANPSTYFDDDHLIYSAIRHRSHQILRFLLTNGTDVEQPRSCQFTSDSYPLRLAILYSNNVALEVLLNHGAATGTGAEPSTELKTPLILAMHYHKKAAISILLQYGADPAYSLQQMGLLESTAQKFSEWTRLAYSLDILVIFLESGIDLTHLAPHICCALFDTTINGDWGTVHFARRNLEAVKWLVERGASTKTSCTEFASLILDELRQGHVKSDVVRIIFGRNLTRSRRGQPSIKESGGSE